MRLTVGTKPNRNGNSRRVTFDTENERYYTDGCADIYIDLHVTASEVKALIEELENAGYEEVIRL